MSQKISIGDVTLQPTVEDGYLQSIGDVRANDAPLRNTQLRFLPWFDSYEGEVFRHFRLEDIEENENGATIRTTTESDPDTLFRERRDSSGDICLKTRHWDCAPATGEFNIHLRPANETVDGRRFTGFTYWFEYRSDSTPIHRMVDRQTWELGGNTENTALICRNLFDYPKKALSSAAEFSTVGLNQSVGALPGNLWGRWSLLPAFDMQYGPDGIFLGCFDEVSLIRSVVETLSGEDWVRYVDVHYFEQDNTVITNPKTILYCPDQLDNVDAVNLWTRMHDREAEKVRRQFNIPAEEAPRLAYGHELKRDSTFEDIENPALSVAEEFGLDQIFIGPVWESGETFNQTLKNLLSEETIENTAISKLRYQNKCTGLDIKVGEALGGEEGLKNLCDRAAEKNIDVLAWMAAHLSSRTNSVNDPAFEKDKMGLFAMKESGKHPDSGYTSECWPLDLNNPAVYKKFHDGFLEMSKKTGLKGFLWDSFSNLGWWHIDYRHETMRPQFDKVCQMYADLLNSGHHMTVEAIPAFSSHACVGLHGGNVYADELMPYSYDSNFRLDYCADDQEDNNKQDQVKRMLKGEKPFDELFHCFAHRRAPRFPPTTLDQDRDQWDPESVQAFKDIINTYKAVRDKMKRRTVLKEGRGVFWEDGSDTAILFSFCDQPCDVEATDSLSGQSVMDGHRLRKNHAYYVPADSLNSL